jgi:hypothetical protein
MYAVFVIAAILLSVSPMHARTLLAALPPMAPGHQFAADQLAQQASRPHLSSVIHQASRPVQATNPFQSHRAAPAAALPLAAPALASASTGLFEHFPNAP